MNEIYFIFLYLIPGIISFLMWKEQENDLVREMPRYVRILIRLSYIILWPIYLTIVLVIICIWAVIKFFNKLIE